MAWCCFLHPCQLFHFLGAVKSPNASQFSFQLLSFLSDNSFLGLMPPTSPLGCRATSHFNEIFKLLSHCFQIYMVKWSGTDHSIALEVQTLKEMSLLVSSTLGEVFYLQNLGDKYCSGTRISSQSFYSQRTAAVWEENPSQETTGWLFATWYIFNGEAS